MTYGDPHGDGEVFIAMVCHECDRPISESDDNAGNYVHVEDEDGERAYHVGCKESLDNIEAARKTLAEADATLNPRRVLPAAAFNVIKGMAHHYGGIGWVCDYENDADHPGVIPADRAARGAPLSVHAMLKEVFAEPGEASGILYTAGLMSAEATNFAPRRIMEREHIELRDSAGRWGRVSFKSWCAELGVVAGGACAECDEPATDGRFCARHYVENKL